MSSGICPSCGSDYERLGQHWAMSSCPYPEIDDGTHKIITGFLMGDCSVARSGGRAKNAALQSNMTNIEFLEWLDNELGIVSNGYNLYKTSEEVYEDGVKNDFFQNPKDPEEYKPIYHWTSIRHPDFNRYEDWYPKPETKVFPKSLKLESDVLKYWYISDGTKYDDKRDRGDPCIFIAATNEIKREDEIIERFQEIGVEAKPVHSTGVNGDPQFSVRFNVDDSRRLWEYMGEPVPGFEDKWP